MIQFAIRSCVNFVVLNRTLKEFQDYKNMRGARTNQQEPIIMLNEGGGRKNDVDNSYFFTFPFKYSWITVDYYCGMESDRSCKIK